MEGGEGGLDGGDGGGEGEGYGGEGEKDPAAEEGNKWCGWRLQNTTLFFPTTLTDSTRIFTG